MTYKKTVEQLKELEKKTKQAQKVWTEYQAELESFMEENFGSGTIEMMSRVWDMKHEEWLGENSNS